MTNLTEEDKRVRQILIGVASKRNGKISCSKLVSEAKLPLDMSSPYDREQLGRILGRIVEYEHEHGRPMLSSVVISDENVRGDGFYRIAEELGYGDWKTLKKNEVFAFDQMNKTYQFWQSNKDKDE